MFHESNESFATSKSTEPYSCLPHSHIWLIRVPDMFLGRRYVELYFMFIREKRVIPLGLYRNYAVTIRHRFVVVNPSQNLILKQGDFVYILGRDP